MDTYKLFFLIISINDVGILEKLKFDLNLELEIFGVFIDEILYFTLFLFKILIVLDSIGYPFLRIIKKHTSFTISSKFFQLKISWIKSLPITKSKLLNS